MTVSGMAVVDGSANPAPATPVGVNTRARVNRSVAQRDRLRRLRASRVAQLAARAGRVVWADAADSWIVREHSPAPRTVWAADYTAHIPGAYPPFVRWCRLWRIPAVLFGVLLDAVKFFLIHPVRGPLALLVAVVIVAGFNL